MGAQKLLLPFGDGPLIRRSVHVALSSGAEAVAVVAGGEAGLIGEALEDLDVELVRNARFESGQASSVEKALDWAAGRADGLVILLGDEPGIEPAIVRRAVEAWAGFPARPLRVRYADRPGHPVIVPLPFAPQPRLSGDRGLRGLLDRVVELSVPDAAPIDIDTEADYREALARLRQ